MARILTGVQDRAPHLGNLLGAVLPYALAENPQMNLFVYC